VRIDVDLSSLQLFTDCNEAELRCLSSALAIEEYQAGDVLMRQGEPGTTFIILLDGVVAVSRHDRGESHTVGRAGRGSILGELALLTQGRRHATVRAETSVRSAVGDEDAFELLLDAPGIYERLIDIAAQHFATVSDPVAVSVPDGIRYLIRPLLRSDRAELASAFARQSEESIRRRFFTAVRPSSRIIDYLVNIDYLDHFAWGVSTYDGERGVAEARYVRLRDDPEVAEMAFDVLDAYQGRGLGTLLLGALAAAATNAGITRFVAEVLYENRPMLAVLGKAGATRRHLEHGVVALSVEVSAAESLVPEPPRSELARAARRVVTAAGLALHAPAR
jgi:CRP-like cAMP-binding protein